MNLRRVLFACCGALLLVVAAGYVWSNQPPPEGIADPAADALARKMMASVDQEAWERTGAVTWTYRGEFNHLWDRKRHLVRVRKGGSETFVNLHRVRGVAFVDGQLLEGAASEEAVRVAYAAWANDSFWLQAMNKAFDPGTTRSRVPRSDGRESLLVAYSSGGVTPGDAYLWHLDESGRPVAWQMWVSILSVKGLTATWEGWEQLPTGAWVAKDHFIGPVALALTDLDAAGDVAGLEPGPDPFGALLNAVGP